MKTFVLLTPKMVTARWNEVQPLLDSAVMHGRGELVVDDVLDLVWAGRMFVSVVKEDEKIVLAIAAEMMYYPRKPVLNLAFVGGKAYPMYDEIYARLEEMAVILGAKAIQCYCRPAVAKLLKAAQPGVEEAYIVVEKKVAQ